MINVYFVFFFRLSKKIAILYIIWFTKGSYAQTTIDSLNSNASLAECIQFALTSQPTLQQARLDERITRQDVRIALADWFPQVELNANLQHYVQQPVSIFPDFTDPSGPKREITTGVVNTSAVQFSVNQTIYSNDLLFAGRTARDLRRRALQGTESAKIDLVVNVSKAYYDVLLTEQQLDVINEDIQRLKKNYSDAYNQYKNGVSDKIDYQRATIALNNANSQKKAIEELVKVKYAYLKEWIGYPGDKPLSVSFDSATLAKDAFIDTLQTLNFGNRIEYQLLQSNLKLQRSRVGYYKWSFAPTLSAFANYNLVFQNDEFPELYKMDYPNSLVGLRLSVPLFEGGKRWQNIRKANLEHQQLELQEQALQSRISSEYTQALASYKSNIVELNASKNNIEIARDIFNTVKFQYDKGIKAYLEVIVAETDLRTAQLNYLNSLFRLLSSVLDVKKALGTIVINNN